jgi:hypothetical protein
MPEIEPKVSLSEMEGRGSLPEAAEKTPEDYNRDKTESY